MKLLIALTAGTFLALASATAAFATSPHFISASAQLSGTNLVVSFKEAGLGNNVLIHEVASADATAMYACINGGGNHPQAANKETVHGPVTASGDFPSGKNGNIVGSLTIAPVGPGDFSCPPDQTLVLGKVLYENVAITDTTNGVTQAISGSFCVSTLNLPGFGC